MDALFPKRATVYPGCVLSVIVNSMAKFDYGSFPYYQWTDFTYSYNGTDGNYAAITFRGDSLVGTFYDHDSDRTPYHCQGVYDVWSFFRGMPTSHRPLAERCLGYWHGEVRGKSVPYVTAAVWDDAEYLMAAEPWEQVWEHGGRLIRIELIEDLDAALGEWQEQHQFSSSEFLVLAGALFRQKMARPEAAIELEPEKVSFLRKAADHPTIYEEGRQALAAIGIHMPPWG